MSSSTDTSTLKDSSGPILAPQNPDTPELKPSVCNIVNNLKPDCNANSEQTPKLNNGTTKPQNSDGNRERNKHETKLPKLKINLQNIDQSHLVNDLSKLKSPIDDKNSSKFVIVHRKDRRDNFPISSKQKQPIMGRTALLKKANIDTDSLIIQGIILNKYDNVLSHYVNRMYKRRASRHSSSECSEDTESLSPYPVSPSTASATFGSDSPKSIGSDSRFEFTTGSKYRYPFYAANYYVPRRRSLEFLKSTDDFNLETTSEELEYSVVSSDTGQAEMSDYDPAVFLETALGELKSVSQLDVYDTSSDKRPAHKSVGPSSVSTLLSKAGSFYSSVKKTIKRRRYSLKAACFFEEHQTDHNSPTTNRLLENLKRDLSIQNSIMYQISKALNYCRASREFVSGKEHIEAEKILLVATITKEALIAEINAIEFNTYENNFDPRCSGAIRICTVSLQVKQKSSAVLCSTESKEYFLAVASCGRKIIASEVMEATDDVILFRKCFEFDKLLADFEICLSIYSMNVKNRMNAIQENLRCPPKSILGCTRDTRRNRDNNTTLYIEPLAFTLLGKCFLRNPSPLKARSSGSVNLKLQNVPSHSSISEWIEVKICQAHNLTNKISGFLTIGMEDEQSVTSWNRRWCLLEGSVFKYWNYPSEEEEAESLGGFDLCYSLAQRIIPADRKICARPRTLLIPIQSGNIEKRYFLSGDTSADMGLWETELNFVIQSLMIWSGLKCPLSPS